MNNSDMEKQPTPKLVSRQRRIPGLHIFCLNTKTGEITDLGQPSRVDVQEGCIYRQRLNKSSFIKGLIREGILVKNK